MSTEPLEQSPKPVVLTVKEVAARLKMDRNEVYEHIREGSLFAIQRKPGGKWRIPIWALRRFTKEDRNGTTR